MVSESIQTISRNEIETGVRQILRGIQLQFQAVDIGLLPTKFNTIRQSFVQADRAFGLNLLILRDIAGKEQFAIVNRQTEQSPEASLLLQ